MKATLENGQFAPIRDCYIEAGGVRWPMYILPEISDSHAAQYTAQNAVGRSIPNYIFNQGGDRNIGWQVKLYADSYERLLYNFYFLRFIESLTYPRIMQGNLPFAPPLIAKVKCGALLGDYSQCVILENYSVKFPTDCPWAEVVSDPNVSGGGSGRTYFPYKLEIDLTFKAVYDAGTLPGSERIITEGN
jgi:hypothetical protein